MKIKKLQEVLEMHTCLYHSNYDFLLVCGAPIKDASIGMQRKRYRTNNIKGHSNKIIRDILEGGYGTVSPNATRGGG